MDMEIDAGSYNEGVIEIIQCGDCDNWDNSFTSDKSCGYCPESDTFWMEDEYCSRSKEKDIDG